MKINGFAGEGDEILLIGKGGTDLIHKFQKTVFAENADVQPASFFDIVELKEHSKLS